MRHSPHLHRHGGTWPAEYLHPKHGQNRNGLANPAEPVDSGDGIGWRLIAARWGGTPACVVASATPFSRLVARHRKGLRCHHAKRQGSTAGGRSSVPKPFVPCRRIGQDRVTWRQAKAATRPLARPTRLRHVSGSTWAGQRRCEGHSCGQGTFTRPESHGLGFRPCRASVCVRRRRRRSCRPHHRQDARLDRVRQ